MAKFDVNNAKFNSEIRKMEVTDPCHADTFNNVFKTLINNDVALNTQYEDITTDMGDKTTLKTTDKTNLVGAVNELFTNANNGKTLISNVVGSPLLATDTFQQQKDKIQTLLNTFATNLTAKEQASVGTEGLKSLVDKVANINVGKRFATGSCNIGKELVYDYPYVFTVNNLNFKPKTIIIKCTQQDYSYDTTFGIVDSSEIANTTIRESRKLAVGDLEILSDGFNCKIRNSTRESTTLKDIDWIAFE